MAPSQLDTIASHIATVVAAESPVTATVLQGVVRKVTSRTLMDIGCQVQSLMLQMATLSGNQGSQFQAPAPAQAPAQAQGQRRGQGRGCGRSDPPPHGRNTKPTNNDQGFWHHSGQAAMIFFLEQSKSRKSARKRQQTNCGKKQ